MLYFFYVTGIPRTFYVPLITKVHVIESNKSIFSVTVTRKITKTFPGKKNSNLSFLFTVCDIIDRLMHAVFDQSGCYMWALVESRISIILALYTWGGTRRNSMKGNA